MIKIYNEPMYYHGGRLFPARESEIASGREKTITYHILNAHNTSGSMDRLKLKFDAMAPTTSPMWVSSRPPALPA